MTNYIKEYRQRKLDKRLKDLSFFGIFGGTILILFGSIKWFVSDISGEKWYIAIAVLGWGLCIVGLIIPDFLDRVYNCFTKFGNLIGKAIFSCMLSLVYIILIIPIGAMIRKKRRSYDIMQWTEEYEGKKEQGFVAWKFDLEKEKNENSIKGIIIRVLAYFFTSGEYILIPSVFILIVIGLFLFFVSSSVIAPFIYTLF